MLTTEIEGLSDAQADFESARWGWSKWSIRRNLSHVASGDFRWLLLRWGRQLFPQGLPDVGDLHSLAASPFDRRLDERVYWDLAIIIEKVRQGLDLCQSVLSKETVGSLRGRELEIEFDAQWHLFSEAHPRGVRQDPAQASRGYITLEAPFRHRYYEYITHLYNIQRLKGTQGLAAKVEIPCEGYWALPGWDRTEA